MSLDRLARQLADQLPDGAVQRDVPVADLTTYRLGGPVAVVVRVTDDAALAAVARVLAAAGSPVPPLLVVGRGSNLLVADRGVAGVGLVLTGDFESIDVDADRPLVTAGAATPLPVLARRAAAAGRAGLEFFVGIPGSVGGAVRMNAGGHGRETAEVLTRAWVLDLLGGDAAPMPCPVADLDLDYRHSGLRAGQVVTRAEFRVTADDPAACAARLDEIVRWRREHQPGGSNAGSVFRNPDGDSAGRLIDALGLKGLRVGGAVVSEKHANFFQAEPGASADDVARLVAEVQARVDDATGVHLVPELRAGRIRRSVPAVTAVATRPPRIDARLRARRVAVRRAEGARRRRRLLVLGGVVVLVAVAAAVTWSPLLSVHRVVVRGAGPHAATVRQAADVTGSMLLVRPGQVASDVERLPWVASARVSREFPTTITITVVARTPVAWSPDGPHQVALVDGHGVVTALAPTAPTGLPELSGLTRVPDLGGRVAPLAPAEVAGALGSTLAPRVQTVALTSVGLVATVAGGPQLRFGDATDLAAKARAAAAVLGALVHPASYVDVSVPSAPVAG